MVIMEAGESQACKVGRQGGGPAGSQCCSAGRRGRCSGFLLLGETALCAMQAINCLAGAHPHGGRNSALLKSTSFSVNLIHRHPHRNIQNNIDLCASSQVDM